MATCKDRYTRIEWVIYAAIWMFAAVLPILLEFREYLDSSIFEWRPVFRWWFGMIPLVVVFLVHNNILIPKVMKKGGMGHYGLSVLIVVVLYAAMVFLSNPPRSVPERKPYEHFGHGPDIPQELFQMPPQRPDRPHHEKPSRPIPMPELFDITLAIMTIGINAAISLLIGYSRERENKKDLENFRLQEELKYLKQQISPHFFMNVLNNIHEMAEDDVPTAQDMILELAQMMRYVLYESENGSTSLAEEVKFISSYVSLMKRRYPEEVVDIRMDIQEPLPEDIRIPPLLFIPFIENAFKHGVSYTRHSMIDIKLSEVGRKVFFTCTNTVVPRQTDTKSEGGVGLANVVRRLDLLYGETYSLTTDKDNDRYSVVLIIPSI